MVCWDVGANVGFYTLLFAELVGSTGRVFAFEPLDRNVDRLRQHVKINGYSNVQIFPSALGNFVGEVAFDPGPGASMGHVAAAGSINVPCTTPDTLIAACEAEPPDVIKIDVEGAEVDVLRGARQLLKSRPAIFLATHGTFAHRQSIELLLASGYEVSALDGGLPDHTDELVALPPGGFRS
ncbi:MAG: FkbM family methyltransferase [Bryobacteraceae bacterium]